MDTSELIHFLIKVGSVAAQVGDAAAPQILEWDLTPLIVPILPKSVSTNVLSFYLFITRCFLTKNINVDGIESNE